MRHSRRKPRAAAPRAAAKPSGAIRRGASGNASRTRRARIADLTATSRKLENDFYAWDDGQYRDRVIKPAWDRAKADLEQAKVELEAAEKQLADLPERARKAGALPGWIRE